MEIVWQRNEVSAREVRIELNETDQHRQLSRSTVRTLMDRMEEKGWLKHRLDGRTFLYSAAQPRKTTLANTLREVIETLCDGRPEDVVATLLDDRGLSREGLQSIRELLDEAEQRLKPPSKNPVREVTGKQKGSKKRREQRGDTVQHKRKPRST